MLRLLFLLAAAIGLADQTGTNQTLTNPTPSDARMNQFEDPKGASWRVFAIDTYPEGPLDIVQVEEVRQQNPPSTWGVYARNHSLMPVDSFRMAAAIVSGDGKVKATQPLPAIKNLKPGQVSRQEIRVIATVLMPTDRVVFFVNELASETATWKAAKELISMQVKEAAKRFPVP
jgi:hypothetical protein